MKKILFYAFMLCCSTVGFTSCNDDNDELTDSKVTYYPTLEIQGDEFTQLPLGTEYVDAGCTGIVNGKDCTSDISVSGVDKIDNTTAGLYYVTYTYVNPDGYIANATRTVAVCDPSISTNIEGSYTVQNGSYRFYNDKTSEYSKYSVSISQAAPGLFYISDILGGWYDQGAGYGENYAMTGYLQLMADNSIQLLSSYVAGWGDSATSFENGKYNPETGEISYDVTYVSGMKFHVVLK